MNQHALPILQISGTPTNVAVLGTSTATPIPLNDRGTRAQMVALWVIGTTDTTFVFFLPGVSTTTVTVGVGVPMLSIQVSTVPIILNVAGHTHIAHIGSTTGSNLVIVPLANQ